jgi:hypothetical protein
MSRGAESSWKPDPGARADARKIIEQALREAGASVGGAVAVDALSAFGRLVRMQAVSDVVGLIPARDVAAALVDRGVAAFDFQALRSAAIELGIAAPDLVEDSAEAESTVLRALALRDRADQLLAGAEILLGAPVLLDEASRALLDGFDRVVRPLLFRVVPLNHARLAALASVAPAERVRLWWYSRGVGIPATALDALGVVAELLDCFPEAANELAELRSAEAWLGKAVHAAAAASHTATGDAAASRQTLVPQIAMSPAAMLNTQPAKVVVESDQDGRRGGSK